MAAVTGAYVALHEAMRTLGFKDNSSPINGSIAGVSAGVVGGEVLLDLCYQEDSQADVDMNVIMTNTDEFIEIQGTAELSPLSKTTLDEILEITKIGIHQLLESQSKALNQTNPIKTVDFG